jgi:hypothetical protein
MAAALAVAHVIEVALGREQLGDMWSIRRPVMPAG